MHNRLTAELTIDYYLSTIRIVVKNGHHQNRPTAIKVSKMPFFRRLLLPVFKYYTVNSTKTCRGEGNSNNVAEYGRIRRARVSPCDMIIPYNRRMIQGQRKVSPPSTSCLPRNPSFLFVGAAENTDKISNKLCGAMQLSLPRSACAEASTFSQTFIANSDQKP